MILQSLCAAPAPKPQDQPVRGLPAVPEEWVPQGDCRAYVSSPWGADNATISRTASKVDIDLDHRFSPDVEVKEAGGGNVDFFVDMPWPLGNIKALGPMEKQGEIVHFQDTRSPRTADMWRLNDGRIYLEVHDPQEGQIPLYITVYATGQEELDADGIIVD